MDINEFEITKRENIIETDNLIPPDWYDESEGGYNYKFTLIEKGKNVTHPKEIYYGTAGSVLGYIDGSYYESCEDEDFRNNITDLKLLNFLKQEKWLIGMKLGIYKVRVLNNLINIIIIIMVLLK